MEDFVFISAAWMLNQIVITHDADGNVVPDDDEYQRLGAEKVYVFSEFMRDKGMLKNGVAVTRSPQFQLRWSDLTEQGQRFARREHDRWLRSLDRDGTHAKIDSTRLERRFQKFSAI